jgi:hypothetical protein
MLYSPTTFGFYSPVIHDGAIPDDAIEITAEEHAALINGQSEGARIVPGRDGQPVLEWPAPPTAAEALDAARTRASRAVEQAVAAIRRAFITDLPAQEMIYLAKEAEARAFLAASAPVLADYPFLSAEAGITAATPTALATLWLALAAQWRTVAARIEAARMTATAALAAATTPAEAEGAVEALRGTLILILAEAGQPEPEE